MQPSVSRRFFISALALSSLGAVAALSGCGADDAAKKEEPAAPAADAVKDASEGADAAAPQTSDDNPLGLVIPGKLTVGSDCDYPPFIWMEGEQPVGFEYDLLKAMCDEMGLELNFLPPQKFDTLVPSIVAGGKMDVAVSSITVTDARMEEVDFTEAYCDSNQSIAVLKDSGYVGRDDLADKVIGVQSGTTGEEWAKENMPDATITPFDDQSSAFAALVAGKVDAVCQDLPISQYMIANAYPECEIVEEIPTGEQYAMAVSKDNPALLSALDEALATEVENGTVDDLYEEYISGKE